MKRVFANPAEWLESNEYNSWLFKYVRFADGVILFCDACNTFDCHKNIVDSRPEVPAVFAGKIQIRNGRWCVKEGGSKTANLTCGESDEKYIGRAIEPFGFVYDDELRYEM